MKAQLALRMKYRLRRYESGTMCRMALAYTPELPNSNLLRKGGGFFQNVADISILYKIFGTRVAADTKA